MKLPPHTLGPPMQKIRYKKRVNFLCQIRVVLSLQEMDVNRELKQVLQSAVIDSTRAEELANEDAEVPPLMAVEPLTVRRSLTWGRQRPRLRQGCDA